MFESVKDWLLKAYSVALDDYLKQQITHDFGRIFPDIYQAELNKVPSLRQVDVDRLPQATKQAMREIVPIFKTVPNLEWSLIGSVNLVLQGVDRTVDDIDFVIGL